VLFSCAFILSVNLDCIIVTHCWGFSWSLAQITKGLKYNSYSVFLAIFSFLPLAVYLVGVTTYWCYFLGIIIYNFVTIYGIATKFGITMCPYPTFQRIKSQGNWIILLCFTTTFTPWRKEKKMRKLSQFLKIRISETLSAIELKIGMWGGDVGRYFHRKNHLVSLKCHGATYTWKSYYCSSC